MKSLLRPKTRNINGYSKSFYQAPDQKNESESLKSVTTGKTLTCIHIAKPRRRQGAKRRSDLIAWSAARDDACVPRLRRLVGLPPWGGETAKSSERAERLPYFNVTAQLFQPAPKALSFGRRIAFARCITADFATMTVSSPNEGGSLFAPRFIRNLRRGHFSVRDEFDCQQPSFTPAIGFPFILFVDDFGHVWPPSFIPMSDYDEAKRRRMPGGWRDARREQRRSSVTDVQQSQAHGRQADSPHLESDLELVWVLPFLSFSCSVLVCQLQTAKWYNSYALGVSEAISAAVLNWAPRSASPVRSWSNCSNAYSPQFLTTNGSGYTAPSPK